jgi:hypothetical protein
MASSETWLEALSAAKALFESVKTGIDFWGAVKKYRHDSDTIKESNRVSRVFSTFSEAEVKSIIQRLEDCRKRFATEGSGEQRARCFCSVFQDVSDANGGIPEIDDWPNMFLQLCSRK